MGIIAFFIFLALMGFFVATTSFLGLPFGTLGQFLPFFLLLVDLHKASLVAIKATSSETRGELTENLGKAMEQVGMDWLRIYAIGLLFLYLTCTV